jgi:hypothetical protein
MVYNLHVPRESVSTKTSCAALSCLRDAAAEHRNTEKKAPQSLLLSSLFSMMAHACRSGVHDRPAEAQRPVVVLVADTAMAAAEGVLDTTTFVVGKGGRDHRVEEPCAASEGEAAAAAAAAVVVAVRILQNQVDRDIRRNMGVADDIPGSHRRYYQTIQTHARRLPVKKGGAVPIQRSPDSTVVAAVVVMDNHLEHTATEAPRSDLVEAVRDDSPVAVVDRSMVGSIRLWV